MAKKKAVPKKSPRSRPEYLVLKYAWAIISQSGAIRECHTTWNRKEAMVERDLEHPTCVVMRVVISDTMDSGKAH